MPGLSRTVTCCLALLPLPMLVASACAPNRGDSPQAPPPRASEDVSTPAIGRPVTIPTADGVSLAGLAYGAGATTVILSEMGAQHQDTWAPVAKALADSAPGSVTALSYDFRYWRTATDIDDALRERAPDDLRAVMAYARAVGAERIVLVGASLGALATLRVAGDAPDVVGAVIVSAPLGPVDGLALYATLDDRRRRMMIAAVVSARRDAGQRR